MKINIGFLTTFMMIAGVSHSSFAVENNLNFSGALVSEPCELDPATSDLTVDFKTIIVKSLYINSRTNSIPFTINLINCDISLGNQVTMTFKGTESQALPGFLAVTGSASGIAIGLEQQNGIPLPINKPSPELALNNGVTSFTLNAWVEGEPDAIKNSSISTGNFSATATFEMAYE